MNQKVIVISFSGIYDLEPFAHDRHFKHLDFSDIPGTACYCDVAAQREITRRLQYLGPEGFHFIDSGNYHYITKFWTDKIKRPFRLILFDHHTDMQAPQIPGLLTCGSWVREMLLHNHYLKEVVILGTPTGAERKVPPRLGRRVIFDDEDLIHRHVPVHPADEGRFPVYVSIDKDVLSRRDAVTNWDQGTVSLDELGVLLRYILDHEDVIGMDICGEYDLGHSLVEERIAAKEDNAANETILKVSFHPLNDLFRRDTI